jgi:GNAT superfamily N-acetyltransferase
MDANSEVKLRLFEQADLPMLRHWDSAIKGEQFMSRRCPAPNAVGPGNLIAPLWFVIEVDDIPLGTVWLERGKTEEEAVLGILLGDPLFFGRGIGRRAIDLAVQQLKETSPVERVTLNVRINNPRAIACYTRCGFTLATTSEKRLADESCVRYHTMIRELN